MSFPSIGPFECEETVRKSRYHIFFEPIKTFKNGRGTGQTVGEQCRCLWNIRERGTFSRRNIPSVRLELGRYFIVLHSSAGLSACTATLARFGEVGPNGPPDGMWSIQQADLSAVYIIDLFLCTRKRAQRFLGEIMLNFSTAITVGITLTVHNYIFT